MKSPFLQFLSSTLSRLDPIYPRTNVPYGAGDHAATSHPGGGGHRSALGVHAALGAYGLGPAHYAFVLALISGLSLPLGAALGVKLRPHDTTIARWIAIGAGALLFAVSVELYGHSIHSFTAGHTELVPMIILLVTSLAGSYLFTYLSRLWEGEEDSDSENEEEDTESARSLSRSTLKLREPPKHSIDSDPSIASPAKRQGSKVIGDAHHTIPGVTAAHKTGRGISAMVRAIEQHNRWKAQMRWAHLRETMKKYHIISFMQKQAEASKRMRDGTASGLLRRENTDNSRTFWENMRRAWGDTSACGPNPDRMSDFAIQSRAAAMSMLIMLVVDGIPEGILMGFMSASGSLSFTFVLSLVIANFPEGFAGGVLMEQGGVPYIQILLAWAIPMLLTATGAGIACHVLLWLNPTYTGGHTNPYNIQVLVCLTEGVAGGAMISGIAATMLPEAYERRDKKGGIMGSGGFLCTFGFLLAFGIKVALD